MSEIDQGTILYNSEEAFVVENNSDLPEDSSMGQINLFETRPGQHNS